MYLLIYCGFLNVETISFLKTFSENRRAYNITKMSKPITDYLKRSCSAPLSTEEAATGGVFRNFGKFTGKHVCQSLHFNEVAGLRSATLLK